MQHDHRWHRARTIRRQPRGAASFAVMLLVGVAGGLVGERLLPPIPHRLLPTSLTAPRSLPAVAFGLCHTGGGENCVVDGDTFWMSGEKIRIADIDTPETHPARCPREADLGGQATLRLQALLNAGPITLEIDGRDTDRYGRKLRIVERDGRSLGDALIAEGLARRWTGRRRPWCEA